MDSSEVKLSARAAFSYVWYKGCDSNKFCAVKLGGALVAFLSSVFGGYVVTISELEKVQVNHSESIFSKEYLAMDDRKVSVASVNEHKDALVTVSLSLTEFIRLSRNNEFDDDILYVIPQEFVISDSIDKVHFPKHLKVEGNLFLDGKNVVHLPDDINISGVVKINGCKDLESMSNVCIEGTGDFVVMNCENLKHGPKKINVAYAEFNRCKNLVGMGAVSSKWFYCILCPNLKDVDFTEAVEVSVGRECPGIEGKTRC